jgi:DNA sulfur modification protein DndC
LHGGGEGPEPGRLCRVRLCRVHPLLDFRDWLASIRNDKERRQARRRDGRITITDGGTFVPGPFTLQTALEIFERLRALEEETGQALISEEEIGLIHELWAEEIAAYARQGR